MKNSPYSHTDRVAHMQALNQDQAWLWAGEVLKGMLIWVWIFVRRSENLKILWQERKTVRFRLLKDNSCFFEWTEEGPGLRKDIISITVREVVIIQMCEIIIIKEIWSNMWKNRSIFIEYSRKQP